MPAGQVWKQHYFAGGQMLAVRVRTSASDNLYYILSDHLGSTSVTVNTYGQAVAEERYTPWGESRYAQGVTPTAYLYTGQQLEEGIGLYYYRARWYDAALGLFAQADTLIPEPGNLRRSSIPPQRLPLAV